MSTDLAGIDQQDTGLDEAVLRRWLSQLRRPDQLASSETVRLLTVHGRLPADSSSLAIGQAAADLLTEFIERFRPSDDATRDQRLPYQILHMCFIEGAKLFQAAGRLGLSERQLSRERSRAIKLLREELENPLRHRRYQHEPIPAILDFLPRPAQSKALQAALAASHLVNVHGPPGIGKTSLVAELATEVLETTPVLWYRFRPEINITLNALLFELGEWLHSQGSPELTLLLERTLPEIEATLATRLAIQGLGRGPQLLVFDDYHLVEEEPSVVALIDEMVARLPLLRVITLSRHKNSGNQAGVPFEITPLARTETRDLLQLLRIDCEPKMVRTLHAWTEGNPHLLKLAASWLNTATNDEVAQGVASLGTLAEVQGFLLSNVTELLDSDDWDVLAAASVFRGHFSDDALAYVSRHSRGAIVDASLRFVRSYAATRSRTGDCAFFHGTLRDYVYERLESEKRAELHERAAKWYERNGQKTEASYHKRQAERLEAFV